MVDLVRPGGRGFYAAASHVIKRRYPEMSEARQVALQKLMVRRFQIEQNQLEQSRKAQSNPSRAPVGGLTLREVAAAMCRLEERTDSHRRLAAALYYDPQRAIQAHMLAEPWAADRLARHPVVDGMLSDNAYVRMAAGATQSPVADYVRSLSPLYADLASGKPIGAAAAAFASPMIENHLGLGHNTKSTFARLSDALTFTDWTK